MCGAENTVATCLGLLDCNDNAPTHDVQPPCPSHVFCVTCVTTSETNQVFLLKLVFPDHVTPAR